MASILRIVGPPAVILLFWIAFAGILWPWQARSHIDKDLPTDQHSERIYRDFEFFLKTFLAIGGAFGYLRIEKYKVDEELIRNAMQALGLVGLAVAWLFGIFIISHQGSKLRRWKHVEWPKIYFWQEIWMCLGMWGFATALWIASLTW